MQEGVEGVGAAAVSIGALLQRPGLHTKKENHVPPPKDFMKKAKKYPIFVYFFLALSCLFNIGCHFDLFIYAHHFFEVQCHG